MNLNQQSLSESETLKIKDWLSLPEAELFKRAIASEALKFQAQGCDLYSSKDNNELNIRRAEECFKRADRLQCIVEKMNKCLTEDAAFFVATINP